MEDKNYTLNDLEQKISNYLYNTDPSVYTDMDYALLQWLTVQKTRCEISSS